MYEDDWLEARYEDIHGDPYGYDETDIEDIRSDRYDWGMGDIPETDDEMYEVLESGELDEIDF